MQQTLGIALALYNGAAYLERQLESLLHQSRQADAVVIADDASTDNSVQIAEAFIARNALNGRWRVTRNTRNAGYTENFFRAAAQLNTDVIFFCDQDDVWAAEKLERMAAVLAARSEVLLLVSGYRFVRRDGTPIHALRYGKFSNSGRVKRITARRTVCRFNYPGMCMAVRGEFWRAVCAPVREAGLPFDRLFALLAEARQGFYLLDAVLADHRMHDANAGGEQLRAGQYLQRDNKLWELGSAIAWHEAALRLDKQLSARALKCERGYLAGLRLRRSGLQTRKIGPCLQAFFRHPRLCGIGGALGDVYILMRRR